MKKYLLGLFAFVLAIGASAFTSNKEVKAKSLTAKYWVYNLYGQPGQDLAINQDNPQNYSLTGGGGTEQLNCPAGEHRCGVLAEESGGEPIMSGATIFLRN